jgi:hypothetical protein
MAIRAAAHQRVTPQLRLRSRRCTSAHTKAPDGPGSQRPGPGSSRRRPAAAGRLHRYAPITPPNSKHAGLRRRRGPVLPFLPSFAFFVSQSGRHRWGRAHRAEPGAAGHLGEADAGRVGYTPAQIGITEKKVCAAVIAHMAQVRVRRSRATRRGSTRSHIGAVRLPGLHAGHAQGAQTERVQLGRGGSRGSWSVASRYGHRRYESHPRKPQVKQSTRRCALDRPKGQRQCQRRRAATRPQLGWTVSRAGTPTAAVDDR